MMLLGKYKLLDKIGSGSFGSIYMCNYHSDAGYNTQNKEHYAAKIVHLYSCRRRREKEMVNSNTRSNSTNFSKA